MGTGGRMLTPASGPSVLPRRGRSRLPIHARMGIDNALSDNDLRLPILKWSRNRLQVGRATSNGTPPPARRRRALPMQIVLS